MLQTEDVDYVIASDTDSIYLNFGPLVDKFFSNKRREKTEIVGIIDQICQDKLEPFIEKSYQDLATYVNAYDQKMQMKRENIADRASGRQRNDTSSMFGTVRVSGMRTRN